MTVVSFQMPQENWFWKNFDRRTSFLENNFEAQEFTEKAHEFTKP